MRGRPGGCWPSAGAGLGGLSRGQEDWVAFPTHHGPWLVHECWEVSPLLLLFIISVRMDAVKGNPVQPPERGNIENKQGIPWWSSG